MTTSNLTSAKAAELVAIRGSMRAKERNLARGLVLLSLLFLVPLLAATYWMHAQAEHELESGELERDSLRARTLAALVEREFLSTQKVLVSIAARPSVRQAWAKRDPTELEKHLRETLELEPTLLFASVYEPDGTLRVIYPHDRIVGQNFAYRDWYRGVTANWRPYVSEVYRTAAYSNPLVVAVAVPIYDDQNKPCGILMAPYALDQLARRFQVLETESAGMAYVADRHGTVAVARRIDFLGESVRGPGADAVARALAGAQGGGRFGTGGQRVFVGYAPAPRLGWAVIYVRPATVALQPAADLRRRYRSIALYLVLIYLATVALTAFLVRRQSRLLNANQALNQELRERERGTRLILDTAHDAFVAIDVGGVITDWNAQAEATFGWPREEAVGRVLADTIIPPQHREAHKRGLEHFLATGEGPVLNKRIELTALHRNGHEFPVELTISSARLGQTHIFHAFLHDITDRKQAEKELREQKQLQELILGSMGDGVVVADQNGKFLLFNPAAERILGMGATDATPDQWTSQYGLYLPDKITPYPAENLPLAWAIRGEAVDAAEVFVRRPNVPAGIWVSVTARPLRDPDGTLRGGVVVFYDITERKRAEEALRQSEERYHLLFDSNPHPVWVYDLKTLAMLDVNRSAVRNYGFSREEFLSLTIKDIRPQEDVPALLESATRALPDTEAAGVWKHRKKDGTLIDVEITSHPLVYGGRDARLVVATDVTEHKRTEERIMHAKEEAERANKFKDQFLSTMSHELRTPMNAVLGFSELLADERYGTLNERQRRYITHIHQAGRHLLRLINDILDLSKIEAGRLELAIESVPMERTLAEALDALRPLADKKSQTLSHQAESRLTVRADATRLKQVLMNLLGNAVKFTPEGGRIDLAARLVDGKVRVEVRDTGPGIPPEEQKRIFEAFYRLRQSGKAPEGTGLGLAITQRLVELHGGQLGLESQPGHGSCFHFSLPVAVEIQEAPSGELAFDEGATEAPRILVIEDDPVASQLIQSQLTSAGYEVVTCMQPERATEMAAELRPDAITLDVLMKPVDGLQVLLELKTDPRTARIPLIVLTIMDQPAIGAMLGADEYLVKPVDKAVLLAAIERCLSSRGTLPPVRPILVVEDDKPTREVIAELLTAQGYAVATAADGAEARDWVGDSLPELVILDLLLPKISGFELLAEWRANPRTADLPVFVLTSKDLSLHEEKYLRAHAESLFHKQQPWQEALVKQLRRVVGHREAVKR